ncbi:prepilin-type N-terminal cleavage/methylation domain-containing protein [Verrucomicrobium sp. BvORR106]|uniref:prepilin-type N-terminal cleavage/methylation domain-containing protein n=1 Tax=Verrucomicrobium sp. BvORR106 TaxID=1403819 RepID=UPI00056E369D|nr:prepilin-type N-terminal cleavage/methylation domain-containing protein [Verrucomicrobium sp. BvORR106]
MKCLPTTGRRNGFSLVEVALAIAIIGFSLLAVVGLLPPLMKTERDSGFNSLLPRMVSVAVGELRSRTFPSSLTETVEFRFNESGTVAAGDEQALYLCHVTFSQIPTPTSTAAAKGGIPDVGTDACLATLKWTFNLEPGRAPQIIHVSLAKEK